MPMMLTLLWLVFADLLGYVPTRSRTAIFTLIAFAVLC